MRTGMPKLLLLTVLLCVSCGAAGSVDAEGSPSVDCRQGCDALELGTREDFLVLTDSEPVPLRVGANTCARLTGPATFHADGSGYMLDSCQTFDNKGPYGKTWLVIAEPLEPGRVHVETGSADPGYCELSCRQ
jgi:hypothetical protein